MSGPPKGVEASELWSRLATRSRPSTLVDFPGKESPGQVQIVVLTATEMQECRAAAEKEAKKMLAGSESRMGDLGYEDIYRNEIVVQVICKACRAVDDWRIPCFPSPKMARDKLTEDDFAVLFEAYKAWKVEAGPIIAEMTDAEVDAWIRVLQEGASRVPLAALSSEAKTDAILLLAARLSKLQTPSGSAGKQQESSG